MPLPGTKVIHRDFSAHHQASVETAFTATCLITRPSSEIGAWNPVTGATATPDADTLYSGPCRVQASGSKAADAEALDQTVTTREYLIAVTAAPPSTSDGPPALRAGANGDRVTITACPDDELLVGRVLRIADITHGSVLWQRDLICVDDFNVNNPD